MNQKIRKSADDILKLQESIYAHINTNRYQANLISDSKVWNQICSSLDVISDTIMAILSYCSNDYPKDTGLQYIYTYGLLQSLFIQQDAVKNLTKAFGEEYQISESLKKIRDIRNSAIGHPTYEPTKENVYYTYLSRNTLSKESFSYMRSSASGEDFFHDVNIEEILESQLLGVLDKYKFISDLLIETDKKHKERHREQLMVNIFPSSMSYLFQKVAQAIYSPDVSNVAFGGSMLESIERIYRDFEKELMNRNEIQGNEYLKYDLDQYFHAIDKLRKYFKEESKEMNERDARVYHYYLEKEHNNFIKIAEEYDEEYQDKKLEKNN
ncbi:hypothetical protein [Thiothrix nivea]|uniref:Uncharacterized protein n=1 Tax=Thiothrix nivea (strain ATCC 35100 / DSM 5205 / JP2) TaxID=870187 RepID=A0A656HIS3_THINJ|nr:hypothetical protein [Thiothrix nivea]EIJ35290.1 hypothetical protein Thini_2753 [Thiothrix nivea DSM 5205]